MWRACWSKPGGSVEQLSALHAVDTAIGSTTDLRVSLQAVLESVIHQLGADAADVLLLNPSTLTLQYSAGSGFFTSEINRSSDSIGLGRAGRAALERQMIYIPDLGAANTGFTRETWWRQRGSRPMWPCH